MIARKRSAPGLRITGAYSTLRLAAYHLLAIVQLPSGFCISGAIKGRLAPGVGGGTPGNGGWSDPRERVVVFKRGAVSSFSWGSSIAPGDNGALNLLRALS